MVIHTVEIGGAFVQVIPLVDHLNVLNDLLQTKEDNITMKHPLELVFRDVVKQVVDGKGQRHGGGAVPFYEQQWVHHAETHGNGFLTGQAAKKLTEAVRSGHIKYNAEAFEREVLGAIAYLGMAILHHRRYPDPRMVHRLWETGDIRLPDSIVDGNGEVVLALCKDCGRAESELSEPCAPRS